jgi:hypothetical protein
MQSCLFSLQTDKCYFSYAPCITSEDGDTVRNARGFRNVPCTCGQGISTSDRLHKILTRKQALFAYHIEALVPLSPQSAHMSQTPQRVNGTRDVHFFSVGNQGGRTLVGYMKKKGVGLYDITRQTY